MREKERRIVCVRVSVMCEFERERERMKERVIIGQPFVLFQGHFFN